MAKSTPGTMDYLSVRPYQLMCVVCKLGSGLPPDLWPARLSGLFRQAQADADVPVTLRCNVDSVYRYQNPGPAEDTPEGELFNAKRDLDILQRMGLVPGATRPLRELFSRLLDSVPTAAGICGYDQAQSPVWRGCAEAAGGDYERGRAQGLAAVVPPRAEQEKARVKEASARAVYEADRLLIRPHHLMCMACFHGGKAELAPIAEDNLFEAIAAIQRNPDIPVVLVAGCCIICPPCSCYDAKTNLCVGGSSRGLRDQKKDLDVLQRLGLQFGDALPARRIYSLLFDRIPSTTLICGYGDGVARAPEWTVCGGPEGSDAYTKARAAGLGLPNE